MSVTDVTASPSTLRGAAWLASLDGLRAAREAGEGVGDTAMGCCYSSEHDEDEDPLIQQRDASARRKAADAALLRVGNMAQRMRPLGRRPQEPAGAGRGRGGSSAYGDGMRWTAG